MDVTIEVHCSQCGSANYSLPDGAAPNGRMICNDCSTEMGTIAALQAEMMDRVLAQESSELRRQADLGGRKPA